VIYKTGLLRSFNIAKHIDMTSCMSKSPMRMLQRSEIKSHLAWLCFPVLLHFI